MHTERAELELQLSPELSPLAVCTAAIRKQMNLHLEIVRRQSLKP